MNVRFDFDVGDTVTLGPNQSKYTGRVAYVRWDGFKADYFVTYWDEDKARCELWLDEAELSKTE